MERRRRGPGGEQNRTFFWFFFSLAAIAFIGSLLILAHASCFCSSSALRRKAPDCLSPSCEDQAQKITDEHVKKIDEIVAAKEREMMAV